MAAAFCATATLLPPAFVLPQHSSSRGNANAHTQLCVMNVTFEPKMQHTQKAMPEALRGYLRHQRVGCAHAVESTRRSAVVVGRCGRQGMPRYGLSNSAALQGLEGVAPEVVVTRYQIVKVEPKKHQVSGRHRTLTICVPENTMTGKPK